MTAQRAPDSQRRFRRGSDVTSGLSPSSPNRVRSRRAWIFGVPLTLLGLTAIWWFVWVPNWRPPLNDDEWYGIDVSAHQGEIDWELVANDDIDFAYIKASEGEDFVDDL